MRLVDRGWRDMWDDAWTEVVDFLARGSCLLTPNQLQPFPISSPPPPRRPCSDATYIHVAASAPSMRVLLVLSTHARGILRWSILLPAATLIHLLFSKLDVRYLKGFRYRRVNEYTR